MVAAQTLPEKVSAAKSLIAKYGTQIETLLPKHIRPERMIQLLRTAITRRPRLAECKPFDLLAAVIEVSSMGLEPEVGGQAWILPYRNRKTGGTDAQVIIGYKGYLTLAYNSNKVLEVWSNIVHEHDQFGRQLGTNRVISHVPNDSNRGEPIGVYAIARVAVADHIAQPFEYLTTEEIAEYKSCSEAAKSEYSPWNHRMFWRDMWRKTAWRRLQVWIPKSIELAKAEQLDEQADIGAVQDYTVTDVLADAGCEEASGRLDQAGAQEHSQREQEIKDQIDKARAKQPKPKVAANAESQAP